MHVPDEWLPRKFSCHTKPGLQTDWFYSSCSLYQQMLACRRHQHAATKQEAAP